MPQIVLHLILLSNHKKSKKERRITEIFLQRIPFSLKNYFCLEDVWLSLLGTNAQVLLSARSPSLILRCALGLALPCGSAALSEAQSKPRPCAASAGLALSVIASRCHLSQSERPWQSAKFPVPHFTPCCRKGSRRRFAQTFRLCQGLPLWGSWREAPERASPMAAGLRVSFDQTYDKSQCRPPRRGGAASDWESYHLNPHFLKYRIRFPACQRAGFRLRWAARCHAWMAVYWGTR